MQYKQSKRKFHLPINFKILENREERIKGGGDSQFHSSDFPFFE